MSDGQKLANVQEVIMSEFKRVRNVGEEHPELLYYVNLVSTEIFENRVENSLVEDTRRSFRGVSEEQLLRSIIRVQNSDRKSRILRNMDSLLAFTNSPQTIFPQFRVENGRLSTILIFAAIKGASEDHLRRIIQSWLWTRYSGMSMAGKEMPHDRYLSDDHQIFMEKVAKIQQQQAQASDKHGSETE